MTKIIARVCIFICSLQVHGQAIADFSSGIIYLNKNEGSLGNDAKKRGYYIGPHVLGDTITMLLNRFENDFVYYETELGAYAVEEKKIIKPQIYKAVKRVNKYYKKEVKGDRTSKAVAYGRMKLLLMKAIKLKNYYTEGVEKELSKLKKPEAIEEFMAKIKFR